MNFFNRWMTKCYELLSSFRLYGTLKCLSFLMYGPIIYVAFCMLSMNYHHINFTTSPSNWDKLISSTWHYILDITSFYFFILHLFKYALYHHGRVTCLYIQLCMGTRWWQDISINTLSRRQNGIIFVDDIFKCFFMNESLHILIQILLNFLTNSPIARKPDDVIFNNKPRARGLVG